MSPTREHLNNPGVPSINIITDVAPPQEHTFPPPQDLSHFPGFLSPYSPTYRGQLSPPSPTHSDVSDCSVPPSPTLSSHTATNFPTSLHLRDNKPDEKSGLSSLQLLDAGGITAHRKPSHATITSDFDGETFRSPSILDHSANISATNVATEQTISSEDRQNKKKRKTEDEHNETSLTTHQRELAQDESVNCAPFRYKPFQLAHMLDPKNMGTLTALGGMDGIIRGLGTHPSRGLTTTAVHTNGKLPQGAGEGASHSHDSEKQTDSSQLHGGLPNIILTEPSGKETRPSEGDDNAPYTATMDDRKRVYGENVLPTRVSKTLLELMATALKDKVLVSCGGLPPIFLSQRLSSQ